MLVFIKGKRVNVSNNVLIDNLIKKISRLPSLGGRSARRIVLHLLTKSRGDMIELAHALEQTAARINPCEQCHNLTSEHLCDICQDETRDQTLMCVVRDVSDLWALERTRAYKGQYHILGGVLSAMDGIGPNDLDLSGLVSRLKVMNIHEVILALGATVDGQATAHYINEVVEKEIPEGIEVSRLAQGVPVGGELDYMDDGTLITALKSRGRLSA